MDPADGISGPVEFESYFSRLKLQVDNYIFIPNDMDDFQKPVKILYPRLNPLNCKYGRGYVQVVAGFVVKREKIYDIKQFNLPMFKTMMDGVWGREGDTAPTWGKTIVTVTLCREFFPARLPVAPMRIKLVKDEMT